MKITKRVLSLFLTMLMLLSIATITSAAVTTHTIAKNGECTINASDYSLASSVYVLNEQEVASSGDITVSDTRLSIIEEKSVGETVVPVISTVNYTLNVESTGYYKISVCGYYTNSAPVITAAIDNGTSKTARTLAKSSDKNRKIGLFNIEAGQHTLTLKIKDGDANIKNILINDIEHYVADNSTTIIAANNYYSTSGVDTEAAQQDYGIVFPTGYDEAPDIRGPLVISSNETGNLGVGGGASAKYKLNVDTAGQYRLKMYSSPQAKNTISVDVNVYYNNKVVAYGRGVPDRWYTNVTYVDPNGVVETSAFNLDAGSQEIVLNIIPFNNDFTTDWTNLFFYYFELERINDKQATVAVYDSVVNEIEAEDVFYTDEGVASEVGSATITANTTAVFYADVATAGNYAFSIKYKADDNTSLKVNSSKAVEYDDNFTNNKLLRTNLPKTDIYKNSLLPTNSEYLTHTLAVSELPKGENRITITPDKDLEIEKIYIKKVSDEPTLSTINAAETEEALKAAIEAAESTLNVELTDATNGIFYDKPVYNRLIKRDYSSVKDFIAEYNKALISEYDKPWVELYINGDKKLELETGSIKFVVSTGYVPKGSTMIVALYENLADGFKTLHNFAICEEVSENTYDFLFGQTEINPEKSYTLEFYYWDGLENVSPIEVFNAVYEEIYVSADADAENPDGTKEKPYPTIQAALEKVKQINDYQWGDIIVNVSGGMYTITETMVIDEDYSGKNGYNVIIRGEENSQPIISGGRRVEGWTEGDDGIWSAPLSDVEYVRNLYINGYPAVMARSDRHYDTAESKQDSNRISTTIYNVGSDETTVETKDILMTEESTGIAAEYVETVKDYGFSMSLKELGTDFEHPQGMEFVWPYTFENHITPVTSYYKSGDLISFYMNKDLLKKRGDTAFVTGSSFYLQNAKELIDEQGEFCYDAIDKRIYYLPYDDEDMTSPSTKAYIGIVEGMVQVAGSSLESKVENITFENLAFQYGANNFISKYGYIGSQTDGILVPFSWSDGDIAYMAQFAVDNADNVNIVGCEFSCLGSAAISMIDSVSDSSITGNIIRDISGTGIRIGHPSHNRERAGVEVCRNIDITNNVIRRIAGEMFNNCAITVYYEKFINILHNDIENVPYSGMSIGWGWGGGLAYDHSDIKISNNRIKNVMNSLSDGGGIYTLGPIKNCIISDNYIEDHNAGHGGLIYNDQGSALIEVCNNVAIDGHQTHSITNTKNMSTQKLYIHDNYSDAGTHSKIYDGLDINFEPYKIVTGKGDDLTGPALNIYSNSGLLDDYKTLLLKPGVEVPAGRAVRSELPDPPLRDETIIPATAYDLDNSEGDFERVEHSNGTGVVLKYGQKISYKLNIEKVGNYKIVLRARKADVSGTNDITVGGDATDVIMHTSGGRVVADKDKDYNYRVCTAYFEKTGENELTFQLNNTDAGIIIKEVQYCPIEQIIESDKLNVIKIKNYNTYKGTYSNGYENYQDGYTSVGADKRVVGCVTAAAGRTTTFTYDINVKEAGTYEIKAAAWIKNSGTYTVTVGDKTATNETSSYPSLKKTDVTTVGEIELSETDETLTFTCTMPSGSGSGSLAYLYYLTLEKKN